MLVPVVELERTCTVLILELHSPGYYKLYWSSFGILETAYEQIGQSNDPIIDIGWAKGHLYVSVITAHVSIVSLSVCIFKAPLPP